MNLDMTMSPASQAVLVSAVFAIAAFAALAFLVRLVGRRVKSDRTFRRLQDLMVRSQQPSEPIEAWVDRMNARFAGAPRASE